MTLSTGHVVTRTGLSFSGITYLHLSLLQVYTMCCIFGGSDTNLSALFKESSKHVAVVMLAIHIAQSREMCNAFYTICNARMCILHCEWVGNFYVLLSMATHIHIQLVKLVRPGLYSGVV